MDLTQYVGTVGAREFLAPAVRTLLGANPLTLEGAAHLASPITYAGKETAACFILQGDRDGYVNVRQATDFYKALKGKGAHVRLRIFPGKGHDLYPDAIGDTIAFFQEYLRTE